MCRILEHNKPPISNILYKDPNKDATPERTHKGQGVWQDPAHHHNFHQGTPEQLLSHVQMALETISKQGLDTDYQMACKEDTEAMKKLTLAT